VIAFIGSVFSPYYAFARRKAPAEAEHYCAINVALYGRENNRWCMTERGRTALGRDGNTLRIGPSAFAWNGEALDIEVDEITAPIPRKLRGCVRVVPGSLGEVERCLDGAGQHYWRPIAHAARVEVSFQSPERSWSGHGYWDSNWGTVPLEDSFESWVWSRGRSQDGTVVAYDVILKSGEHRAFCLDFGVADGVREYSAPETRPLSGALWRMERSAHSEEPPRLLRTLEDAPFYTRSIVENTLLGRRMVSMHESLSLTRFRMPIVQAMLPFRMPRRSRYLSRLSL
jgi:carotenoid 1,2-hydratase